jgi:small neutral amino acid transporter SnatA (MarC family)
MAPVVMALVKRTSAASRLRTAYTSVLAVLSYYFFVLFVLATLSHTTELFQVSGQKMTNLGHGLRTQSAAQISTNQHKSAQISTNQHKSAQISTNQHPIINQIIIHGSSV